MSTRKAWDINDGFETTPPDTRQYLYIEVDVPDFYNTYTLAHATKEADFKSLGIKITDLDSYVEGQHVFVVNFSMKPDYADTPVKTVKVPTTAYIDAAQGTGYHILAMADDRKKKYRRKMGTMLSDQR